jgi:transcriptional regulator with XRE-family HTH domain
MLSIAMARKDTGHEVQRILAMLRDAVRYSNLSNREVERRLGVSANSGYLSRLFAGDRELKLRQILEILQVVGLPPANFFRAAFSTPDESAESLRLEHILAHAHPAGPAAEQPAKPVEPVALTEDQIEEMMKRTLRRLLFQDEPPPPPRGRKQ